MKKSNKSALMGMIVKLRYVDEKNQKEAARIAGISEAKVSRYLDEARRIGMVQIKVSQYEPRNRELESKITKTFGLKSTVVIKAPRNRKKDAHYINIGYFAAPCVAEMVQPDSTVSISAGRHIAYMLDEMTSQKVHGISVVQAMGNVGPSISYYDAVEVGRKFASIFSGRFYQLQAPAITTSLEERDVFIKHPHIQMVLDMMTKSNLAIVGIGIPHPNSVFFQNDILKHEDAVTLKQQKVVGEICGRFYDIDGNPIDTKFHDRVIGISLKILKDIPNVIAVTSGIDCTEAILGAVNGKIIKTLVLDEETGEALLAKATKPGKNIEKGASISTQMGAT